MATAAEKIKNFFKKKKSEAKFKVSHSHSFCLFVIPTFVFFNCEFFQLAGPGRRLDGTDSAAAGPSKSLKSQSDVYVPPKRSELTSEARLLSAFILQKKNPTKKK